jgi:hypothetical protein
MLFTGEHVEHRQTIAEEIFAIGQIADQFVESIGEVAQGPLDIEAK